MSYSCPMLAYASRPAPKADRLAAMAEWLRVNSDTPWTWETDAETVLYRIECRYPGGIAGFDRERA